MGWNPPPGWTWQPPPGWTWQPPPGYNPYAAAPAGAPIAPAAAPAPSPPLVVDKYAVTPGAAPGGTPNPVLPPNEPGTTGSSESFDSLDPNYAGPGFGATTSNPGTYDKNNPWNYTGNIGSPPGSNIQVLGPNQDPNQFKYTNTFTNNGTQPQVINIWNSGGTTGAVGTGQSGPPAKSFVLQPGQSVTVAFDTDSHVAWSASPNGTNQGYTWGEASFGTLAPPESVGQSGFDISQINGNQGQMVITDPATGTTTGGSGAWQVSGTGANPYDKGDGGGPKHLTTSVIVT